MLALEAEYPQVGAPAWLKPNDDRPEAEPVRILQRCNDGQVLISRVTLRYRHQACTANLRVTLDHLAPTREEAQFPAGDLPAKRRRTRKAR